MRARIARTRKSLGQRSTAFTLIELLVVMAIIGVLAAIGLPAMKGIGAGNDVAAAIRQLMDDLSYARMKAMNERTTVYVVFVSPQILPPTTQWSGEQAKEVARYANLQFTSYALFTKRSLGDQPGAENPRYITDWRTLPQGTFIPTNKFDTLVAFGAPRTNVTLFNRPFFFGDTSASGKANLIPFPRATNTIAPSPVQMAYIAFDFQGRLKRPANAPELHDIIVPIAKGSIIYPQDDPQKRLDGNLDPAEVIETPKGNATNNPSIRIDWLTGRARVVRPEKIDYAAKF
jgi:prepilin-type N-terminal cleavage/methylation domain-containing protein